MEAESDGIGLAHSALVVKSGLVALADTYGFERSQQEKFNQLAEQLFEHILSRLADLASASLRLTGVWQTGETFSEFCLNDRTQRILVCGEESKPSFAIRLEPTLRRMLWEAALGIPHSAGASRTDCPITATETRVLDRILMVAAGQALRLTLDGDDGTLGSFGVIAAYEGEDRTSTESFSPDECLFAIVGRLSLNGREGVMAIAVPMTPVVRNSANPSFQTVSSGPTDTGKQKARVSLAEALLTLAAVLGKVEMPLTRVKALTPGSLIPLGRIEHGTPTIALCADAQVLFSGTVVADRGWYRFLPQEREKSRGQSERRNAT